MMKRKVDVLYFKYFSFNKAFNKGSTLFLFINHFSTLQQLNKQSKMNISDNKTITDFLQEHGHQPTSVKGNNWWYLSPLRNEHTASFKVDVNKNVWYDFGLGIGGNLRTLVKLLFHGNNCKLPSNHFFESGHPKTRLPEKGNASFSDITIMELKNQSLLSYLKKRGVNEAIGVLYCKEIHYTNHGKRYYAVGFANRNSGYEIRNAYFKGCISPKDISVIEHGNDNCHVFEGFIDFLSYVELHGGCDAVVLNSVINVTKALSVLNKYPKVYCHLDNDEAGCNATKQIMRACVGDVIDASSEYAESKDINEFLCKRMPRLCSRSQK